MEKTKKNREQEHIVVYETLKNTALHCEDGIRHAKTYMYTVYFALFVFGFEHQWLFLVSFFVLITFQTMINNDRLSIERISSYIRVFFETKRNDIHWSLLNKDEEHLSVYRALYQNIGWRINQAASSFLAIVSLIAFTAASIQKYGIDDIPTTVWLEFTAAVLLCCLVIYVNNSAYTGSSRDKGTIKALDGSIEEFYEKYYGSPKV